MFRVCPGQHLADNSLFIVIAMVLAVFDILPADKETPEPDFSKSEGYTSSTIWSAYTIYDSRP